MESKVQEYIQKYDKWKEELEALREIANDTGLTEEFKWRAPCYTLNGKNVVMIGAFKNNVVLSFFKGVLLSNEDGLLVAPGENSQTFKFARFTNVKDIIANSKLLKAKIFEAIEVEKSGAKIELKKSNPDFPEELIDKFKELPDFEKAFKSLTPGRQRAYVLFIDGAKQSKTKISRIEKYIPRILMGKGINDCVCGLSKKMPGCDGSHKQLGGRPVA